MTQRYASPNLSVFVFFSLKRIWCSAVSAIHPYVMSGFVIFVSIWQRIFWFWNVMWKCLECFFLSMCKLFHFKEYYFPKFKLFAVKFVLRVRLVSELSLKVTRKRQNLNIYSCSAPTSTALLSSIKTDEFFMGTIFCNLTLNIVS